MFAFIVNFFSTCVRIFTIMQMHYNSFMKELGIPIYTKFFLGRTPARYPIISYIRDGERIGNNNAEIPDYDFILYENKLSKVVFKNKIDMDNAISENTNEVGELTTWAFISVALQIPGYNGELLLDLKRNDEYSYYVVGNAINSSFLMFFLQEHYPHEYEEMAGNKGYQIIKDGEYSLNIFDHNADILKVDEYSCIKFTKEGYNVN